jgi:hypothetical protein
MRQPAPVRLQAGANLAAAMLQMTAIAVDFRRAGRSDRTAAIALSQRCIDRDKQGRRGCKMRNAFRNHDASSELTRRLCKSKNSGALKCNFSFV